MHAGFSVWQQARSEFAAVAHIHKLEAAKYQDIYLGASMNMSWLRAENDNPK